jgi:hypothetical protein
MSPLKYPKNFRIVTILDAFETSVAQIPPFMPPVKFQINLVSIVPKRASPALRASLTAFIAPKWCLWPDQIPPQNESFSNFL